MDYIDRNALKNANFRTGLGLKSYIDSLPVDPDVVKVTRCENCEFYIPPAPESFDGKIAAVEYGICKVHNMFKKPSDYCSAGNPKE